MEVDNATINTPEGSYSFALLFSWRGSDLIVEVEGEKERLAPDRAFSLTFQSSGVTFHSTTFTPRSISGTEGTFASVVEGDSISVEISGAGSVETLSGEAPPRPATEDDISASCSVGEAEVVEGDDVTVTVTVSNSAGVSADVTVSIEAGGAESTEQVQLPANGETEVSATFAFDEPGEYTPGVSVSL